MPSMMVATLGIALPEIRGTFSLSEVAGRQSLLRHDGRCRSYERRCRPACRSYRPKTRAHHWAYPFGHRLHSRGIQSGYAVVFCCLGVTGVGYGFTSPSLYAIMSDLLPHRRGLGTSLVSVTYGIGGAIGAVLASRIVAAFGWRTAFYSRTDRRRGYVAAVLLDSKYQRRRRAAARSGPIKSALSASTAILAAAEFIGGIRILELSRLDSNRVARR